MINIIGFINKESLTLASLNAIKESDFIISYSFDINKIKDLIDESKEIFFIDNIEDVSDFEDTVEDNKATINEENFYEFNDWNIKACELAISKSKDKNVSIINNAYLNFGFNNLIYQIASKYNKKIDINIYPTISPIDYSSSIIGAPLDDFSVINFANYLIPLSEFERKIKNSIKSNFILAIYNPTSNKELFNKFKEILLENLEEDTILSIVDIEDNSKEIIELNQLCELNQDSINESSIIIVGNKTTYKEDDLMITPRSYMIKNEIVSYTCEFFEKYLNNESPCGIDYDCDYLPCHKELEACDFCYCPFYPCGESSTGGKWIKDKNVWDCQDCIWIHKEKTDKCIRKGLDEFFNDVDDLNIKKEELLRLRRECLFK